MRGVTGIFFLSLYLIALLRPVEPLIEYYLRYEYFSKKLCVNLSRPEMKCNGQCALMQRLKKAAEESGFPELPVTAGNVSWKDYPVGFVVLFHFSTETTDCSKFHCARNDSANLLSGYAGQPDHPPQASV